MPDASAPCSCRLQSLSSPLRRLARRLLAPPVGLVPDPFDRRPAAARVRPPSAKRLGADHRPPVQRHEAAGTLSGRGGEKTRILWGQQGWRHTDGEAMARDGEGWRGEPVETGRGREGQLLVGTSFGLEARPTAAGRCLRRIPGGNTSAPRPESAAAYRRLRRAPRASTADRRSRSRPGCFSRS
jgi:hypothetical protein